MYNILGLKHNMGTKIWISFDGTHYSVYHSWAKTFESLRHKENSEEFKPESDFISAVFATM